MVHDKDFSVGADGNACGETKLPVPSAGAAELAGQHRAAVDADEICGAVGNVNRARRLRINGKVAGHLKLVRARAQLVKTIPLRIENADAAVLFLAQINPPVAGNRNRQWFRETVMHGNALAKRVEHHHLPRRRISNVEIAIRISRHARRPVQLRRQRAEWRDARRGGAHSQGCQNKKKPD